MSDYRILQQYDWNWYNKHFLNCYFRERPQSCSESQTNSFPRKLLHWPEWLLRSCTLTMVDQVAVKESHLYWRAFRNDDLAVPRGILYWLKWTRAGARIPMRLHQCVPGHLGLSLLGLRGRDRQQRHRHGHLPLLVDAAAQRSEHGNCLLDELVLWRQRAVLSVGSYSNRCLLNIFGVPQRDQRAWWISEEGALPPQGREGEAWGSRGASCRLEEASVTFDHI